MKLTKIFLILALSIISSCATRQPIEKKEQVQDYKSEKELSSLNVVKTEPIEQYISIGVGAVKTSKSECDSVCQVELNNLYEKFYSSQKSGKNEVKFYYDKYKKTLNAYVKIQGQTDSITKLKNTTKEYYNITKTITIKTNFLTKEQTINLWIGRLFWLLLLVIIVLKIKEKITI
jgi:hypothetical protein